MAASHHDVSLQLFVRLSQYVQHDVFGDIFNALLDFDLSILLDVDRPAVFGHTAIAVRVKFDQLCGQFMRRCAHDSVDCIFLAVTHIGGPHLLNLLELEVARATELEQMSVGEPRVLCPTLSGQPFLEGHQRLGLSL